MKSPAKFDLHHHAVPEFYVEAMHAAGIKALGGFNFPRWTPERSLRAMDALGTERAWLSVPPGVTFDGIPDPPALARRLNDAIAALVAGHFAEQGASHLAWVSAAGSEAVFAILVAALTNWATDNGMDFSCHVYDGLPDVQASIHEALDAGADGIFAMCGTPKRITEAISDRGLSIPDDILWVMQSEGAIEESMTPQLSNFSYLGTEAGITIAEMCVDVVKNGTHPTQLDLNFELVARESSLRTD